MSMPRYFFQDFLFENMPVDEQEYPVVTLKYLPPDEDTTQYVPISFDVMLRMNHEEEWKDLFTRVAGKDVCIIDNVRIENQEVEPYKRFYLMAYYYTLMNHCQNLDVSSE